MVYNLRTKTQQLARPQCLSKWLEGIKLELIRERITLKRFKSETMANYRASQTHYWLLMLVKLYEVEYDASDRGDSNSRSQRVRREL